MKLNCKPGDLAVIVRGLTTNRNVGKLVTVIGPGFQPGFWIVKSDHPLKAIFGGMGGLSSECTVGPIEDRRLRPIRAPGDDAVDESAAWLPPVPRTAQQVTT